MFNMNFKYIFPGNKVILYYCSCVINRNIKRYLERKKLLLINKIVHIFLEDAIHDARQRYKKNISKKNISKTKSFLIGDKVSTEMGSGVIQTIRNDDIFVVVMDTPSDNCTIGYFNKDSITLLYDDKEIEEKILESSEEYIDNNIEDVNKSYQTQSLYTYVVNKLFAFKTFLMG